LKLLRFKGILVQKIDGGYVLLSKEALIALNAQISSRLIPLVDARGIFAQLEMCAIRDAARASTAKKSKASNRIPEYTAKEISKLSGVSLREASKLFRKGMTHEIFQPRKGSLIPISRRLIKFLAKCSTRALMLTLLTYLERGMTLHGRVIKNAGTVKASFIAKKSGLTIRSVRTARGRLLKLGIITPDTTKYQRKLNRDGAYFTINLSFNQNKIQRQVINRKGSEGSLKNPRAEKVLVNNLASVAPQISPPLAQNCTKISPPYREIKPSPKGELRNQKTQSEASNSSGVFTKRMGEGEGRTILPPSIRNVQKIDLEQFSRCKILYEQACGTKLVKHSEATFLNFIGAAVRAKSAKGGDPAKIFMGIVRQNLWMNITQEQEDRARAAIKRYEP
jgi:CRP-like cAMP-binding protein